MRISIREQLGFLVLLCSLLALMVLALATVRPTPVLLLACYSLFLVVPKLQLHYRHSTFWSCSDRLSEGRTGVLDALALPVSMSGRVYAGTGTIRLVAVQ